MMNIQQNVSRSMKLACPVCVEVEKWTLNCKARGRE